MRSSNARGRTLLCRHGLARVPVPHHHSMTVASSSVLTTRTSCILRTRSACIEVTSGGVEQHRLSVRAPFGRSSRHKGPQDQCVKASDLSHCTTLWLSTPDLAASRCRNLHRAFEASSPNTHVATHPRVGPSRGAAQALERFELRGDPIEQPPRACGDSGGGMLIALPRHRECQSLGHSGSPSPQPRVHTGVFVRPPRHSFPMQSADSEQVEPKVAKGLTPG